MSGYWKLNKEIPFSCDYTARFYTLYEDKRDAMCDSVRPEWGIADRENNRRVEVIDRRGITVFYKEVNKETGNAMYLEMKPLDRCGYGVYQCLDWLKANGARLD